MKIILKNLWGPWITKGIKILSKNERQKVYKISWK